jgi:hypothetical protein
LKKNKRSPGESPRVTDDDDSGNSADEGRLKFSGIKPDKPDISPERLELGYDEHGWEEQQIRKAVKNASLPVEKAPDAGSNKGYGGMLYLPFHYYLPYFNFNDCPFLNIQIMETIVISLIIETVMELQKNLERLSPTILRVSKVV